MVDRVNPSQQRAAESFLTAAAIAGGGATDGYVVQASESPTKQAQVDTIDETQFNQFDESSTDTSLTVTIDAGEAYVYGAWLARDEPTTVSLDANTNNQTIYLGWDNNSDDTVLIGLAGKFGNTDPKIPLFEYDTDSSGRTSVSDVRQTGRDVATKDYADTAVATHSSDTSDVHGVGTSTVESTDGAQSKVDAHADDTTDVHGVTNGDIESTDGAQQKVDDHSAETSGVHGVTSGDVESTDGSQQKVDDHSAETSDVHGVTSGDVESTAGSQQKVDDHAAETSGVHGVGTSVVASEDVVDSKITTHRLNAVHDDPQPPQTHDNTVHSTNYLPESDRYTDSEAVSAADGEVADAANTLAGLDDAVKTNQDDITNLQVSQLETSDVTSANWGDYELQKDGTDETGIINFKTE